MRTTIKFICLTLSLFLISNFAFSQEDTISYNTGAGVYETYESYIKGNLKEYGRYYAISHVLGKFTVIFEDETGKKTEIKIRKGNIWGYRNNDRDIYRIDKRNDPCKVTTTRGKIIIYGNYMKAGHYSRAVPSTPNSAGGIVHSLTQFSFGLNGKMYNLTKKNLKKRLKKINDKRGLKMLKKGGFYYSAMEFVSDYNLMYE